MTSHLSDFSALGQGHVPNFIWREFATFYHRYPGLEYYILHALYPSRWPAFLLLLSPVHKLDSDALLSSPFDSFSPSAELVSEVRVVLAVRNLPSRALEWLDEVKLNRRLQSATSTTIPERQRARLA
ncbi:hypothetical protein E6O75_ATG04036 [Venturia nashicola]|uniref:Uncharacterized protein n=1 Tax=Venturia nashicola TaxID=86259 RepID=A0A4Z1PH28_9PEZI|nr:hypothetical protein E6O75_ATG04035 [Venturia nashicola]TID24831.1 hypothetical protein E6O75_ATG04036 [Venturia nashicola]